MVVPSSALPNLQKIDDSNYIQSRATTGINLTITQILMLFSFRFHVNIIEDLSEFHSASSLSSSDFK